MNPMRINEAPPPAERPKCPECGQALRPLWRTVKSERITNAQGFSVRETLEFTGEYLGYGAFHSLRCAADFANAAHKAGYRRAAK